MFAIEVSNHYHVRTLHGPWRDEQLASRVADRWNRVFDERGWPLRASVRAMVDKSAASRDRLGAMLVQMAQQSHEDELLRTTAKPCECEGFWPVSGSVDDAHPEGVCVCGHDPDEHDGERCDGMVLPDRKLA